MLCILKVHSGVPRLLCSSNRLQTFYSNILINIYLQKSERASADTFTRPVSVLQQEGRGRGRSLTRAVLQPVLCLTNFVFCQPISLSTLRLGCSKVLVQLRRVRVLRLLLVQERLRVF